MTAPAACRCPTCGSPLPEVPLKALLAVCSPQQGRILMLIAEHPGITFGAIQRTLGLARSGTQFRRVRERIAPLGWAIAGREDARWGYRLAPLPAPETPDRLEART